MELEIDKRKSVIIADDDDVILRILEVVLAKLGYKDTRSVPDGQKALVSLMSTTPSLVITDIDMPIMNGLQLVHQIRRHHKYDIVPIIALTANDTKEMVVKALRVGVDAYLIKSDITEAEVSAKIEEALKFRRSRLKKAPHSGAHNQDTYILL